jgi:flagellar protein FlbD
MIKLTRLNHIPMILNSDLIEHIDATPDTVVTLTSGQKIVVLENADDVVEKIVAFRRSLFNKDWLANMSCHKECCCAHPVASKLDRSAGAASEDSSHG